jgi:Transcriptional regulator
MSQSCYYYFDQYGQNKIKEVIKIYQKFENLDTEKQIRIVNAALNEFSVKGYTNASTNEIVKSAGISKGLLFHYFANKKSLFQYLVDYCIDVTMKEFYERIDNDETDLFEKFKKIMIVKLELLDKYPAIFKFIEVAYLDSSVEAHEIMESRSQEVLSSSTSKVFMNIDTTKFKNGFDLEKVINLVLWSLEGYSAAQMKKAKLTSTEVDFRKLFDGADQYINLLKQGFYK